MDLRNYDAFMSPRNVAIIGASNDPDKTSGRTLRFLRQYGYAGGIHPVNPTRDVVQGLPAHPAIAAIEAPIDLAVIATPAHLVQGAVADCVARDVPAVIAIPAGFAELDDEGIRRQADLAAVIDGTGTRVLGPNCIGLVNMGARLTATMDTGLDQEGLELRDGGIAFVTQSGAIGSFVFNVAQGNGIGLGRWISTGNEMDVGLAEMLRALIDDTDVKGVLGYIEGVRDGQGFLDALEQARRIGKPVGLMKVGRSDFGRDAVASHTGALSGTDAVYDGIFEQFGASRIDGLEELVDWAAMVDATVPPAGRRISIATISGGAGALAADTCDALGLELASWEGGWHQRLEALLPDFVSARNPMDMAGAISSPALLEAILRLADEHPGTDVSLLLLGNFERARPGLVDVLRRVAATTRTPIVVAWTGGTGRALDELCRAGIAAYSDPGRALRALRANLRSVEAARRPTRQAPPVEPDRIRAARELLAAAEGEDVGMLDEQRSKQLLALYGLPVVREQVAGDADAAVAAARQLGFPVAVKLLAAGVAHKSELGGVALGLATEDDVRGAIERMVTGLPDELRGRARFLVQELVPDGLEVLLGIKRDPLFGPIVAIGLGGTLTEVLADIQLRVAPVHADEVPELVSQLRFSRLFDEFRGRGPRDLDALASAVAALSQVALELADDIVELDVNPLILGGIGQPSRVVDAVVFAS